MDRPAGEITACSLCITMWRVSCGCPSCGKRRRHHPYWNRNKLPSALVGVTRHGVPQVTRSQLRHPILNWQVSSTSGTKYLLIVHGYWWVHRLTWLEILRPVWLFSGIRRMRRCTIVIKLRRSRVSILAKTTSFAPLPTYRASRDRFHSIDHRR